LEDGDNNEVGLKGWVFFFFILNNLKDGNLVLKVVMIWCGCQTQIIFKDLWIVLILNFDICWGRFLDHACAQTWF